MKTSPPFWQNLYFKYLGTALSGLCLSLALNAQTDPLAAPDSVKYPGIFETLERLIKVDNTKFDRKNDLLQKNGKVYDPANVTSLDLDPDYLNSIILHSDPGYIKLASTNKCRFFDTIINDLLKNADGKIKNVAVSYVTKDGGRGSSLIPRKDFLNKVVSQECPDTPKLIDQFQIKNLDQTIRATNFDTPNGREQCHDVYLNWLNDSKTPYYCKVYEFMKETKNGGGDPADLPQRQAMLRILEKKLSIPQRDYLENVCSHLDNEEIFCQDFLNVSFWSKVASGSADKIFAEDICTKVMNTASLTDGQLKQCLSKLRKESDLCLYPGGRNQGLIPAPQCDSLALALNHSSLRADYRDCPASSDQQAITNMGRVLLNISKDKVQPINGPCSTLSTGVTFEFNRRFDNDEGWKLEACYDDKMAEKEVCHKTFFGGYGAAPEAYNVVVADILRKTRGADMSLKCEMVDSEDYNPLLLQYKSGCYIIYERNKCFISECKHRILYNDRNIDFIRLKNRATLDYFPISIADERTSQHYILTRDYRQNGRVINNASGMIAFFKKGKRGLIHGVGCAEHLLPSFFRVEAMNQCSPLPFIIDGMIRENDKTVFVTRTAADSLQAPRLINWSSIYSAVKTYQRTHPLRLWTLYGMD